MIKGRCDISELEDVLEKYEEPGNSPEVMGTCLQLQAMGGSANLLGHDIQRKQLLSNGEDNWWHAKEMTRTTVSRSMTLKKEAMMEELVSRSHKQVKKQIDHGPIPRRQRTRWGQWKPGLLPRGDADS